MKDQLEPGRTFSYDRTFTEAEVRAFAELSGDKGVHHVAPDAAGRLVLHGLLTATLPTKLGGMMDYMARKMDFEFVRPAWTGQKLTCVGKVESVLKKPNRLKVVFSFLVTNEAGEPVMRGTTDGVIHLSAAPTKP